MQPTMSSRFISRALVSVAGLATLFALSVGSRSTVAQDKPAAPTAEQKAAHLERMLKLAKGISVFEVLDGKHLETKLVEQPVLAYRDDTRKQNDSTMWIWGKGGRPTAIVAVEHYPERPKGTNWLFEIASLSVVPIGADRDPELHWQARKPGLDLKLLTGAPVPAEKPAARLAQMRQLRRRFAAHERTPGEGRIELLPLSAPLHRYQDARQGIIDGAVFAFASGTNPEVLWIIEAHSAKGDTPSSWQFGLAQMTGAEVFVNLDEKEFWRCREADPPAERDSYINGWMADGNE